MKKTLMLLAVLVTCATLASADSIKLYWGAGTMIHRRHGATGTIYHFQFFGYYPYIINAWNTEGIDDRDGLQLCSPCDDPTKISVLLFNTSNGPAEGMIRFDAASYTSVLLPNGNLKVTYTAYPDISLSYQGHEFYWDPNQRTWTVTAVFFKDKYQGWDFWKATFGHPNQLVPEPASFLLLGTGGLLVGRKLRAQRSRKA